MSQHTNGAGTVAPEPIHLPELRLTTEDGSIIRLVIEFRVVGNSPSAPVRVEQSHRHQSALTPVREGYSNLIHGQAKRHDPLAVQPRFIGKDNPSSNGSQTGETPPFEPPLDQWLTLTCLWGAAKLTRENTPYINYRVRVEETGQSGYLSCYDIEAAQITMNRHDPANFRGTIRAVLYRTKAGYLVIKDLAPAQ